MRPAFLPTYPCADAPVDSFGNLVIGDERPGVESEGEIFTLVITAHPRQLDCFDELADIATKSNKVVAGLGVPYTWITTYVAGDKLYSVHETKDIGTISVHANYGGFPADLITEITTSMGPTAA